MEKSNLSTPKGQVPATLRKYWLAPVSLIILALLFLMGSWYGERKAAGQKTAGGKRILYYVDPMNPAHTSPEPGLAPCGMKMEPVYADEGGQDTPLGLAPGSVKITPEKQQIIGVRTAEVEKSPVTYTLRTVGKVAADETRIYQVNAITDGWILQVFKNSTGSLVRKDEPLATYYSNRADLPTALLSYFAAIDLVNNLKQGQQAGPQGVNDLLESQRMAAEITLLNLGISRQQMKDLARDRKLTQEIFIYAPATGFLLARKVSPGQTFKGGDELYRLADLSRVWILADLFEKEAKYIRPGEKVKVSFPREEAPSLATVTGILPEFDPSTLTLKVRLEIANPDFVLRPGMFMDVEFPIKMPPTINIPADAILDSGTKKLVFVDRGKGFFEPRQVNTGWRLGDRVQITGGLKTGERIVTSGNFLIDSESRMKLAAAGFFSNVGKDPVCGNNLDESRAGSAGLKSEFQGRTHYFCSEACKQRFDLTPERYLASSEGNPDHKSPAVSQDRPASPPAPAGVASPPPAPVSAAPAIDPVCGMKVQPEKAQDSGLTSEHQGKTYYFCTDDCKKQFAKEPATFLAKAKAPPDHAPHAAAKDQPQPSGTHSHSSPSSPHQAAAPKVLDPACGLTVNPETAQKAGLTSEFQGKTYYFCTPGCKQRFDKDPQHYLSADSAISKAPPVPYRGKETKFRDPYAPNIFRQKAIRSRTQWASPGADQSLPPVLQGRPSGPSPAMPHGPSAAMPPGPTPAPPLGQSPSMQPGAAAMPPAGAMPPMPQRKTLPAPPGMSQAMPPGIPQVTPPAQPAPLGSPPAPEHTTPDAPEHATPDDEEHHHD